MDKIKSLYCFEVFKTFMWGFAVGILGQKFHTSFHYLGFINQQLFGLTMITFSAIACYNIWRPIQYKSFFKYIPTIFLVFCLFHMSFVVFGYLFNVPIDGAWARNFAEVLAIGWMIFKIKE